MNKAVSWCLCCRGAGGLSSPADEAFAISFADLYSAQSLQVPWYTVLGEGLPSAYLLP